MVERGDLIIVHFLSDQPVGLRFRRRRHDWPLHITLVPWFAAYDEEKFTTELIDTTQNLAPIQVTIGAEESFGPDTPVSLIADQSQIKQFHSTLLKGVDAVEGTIREQQWTGNNYRAHITHHDNQPVPAKFTQLTINRLSLVRIDSENFCEVILNISWGTHHETAA